MSNTPEVSHSKAPYQRSYHGPKLPLVLKISAALLAALGQAVTLQGCGDDKKEPTEPVPVCKTPERQATSAPRPEIQRAEISGRRVRVFFNIPAFDEQCQCPLYVTALGYCTPVNPTQGGGRMVSLGEAMITAAGPDFIEVTVPNEFGPPSSIRLVVVDEQGNEQASDSFATEN